MNKWNKLKIISRFSPSPTGIMHLGNLSSLLNNYLKLFFKNFFFFFRIDDTNYYKYKLFYIKSLIVSFNFVDKIYKKKIIFQSNKFYRYIEISQFLIKKKFFFVSFENFFENKFIKILNNINCGKFKKKKNKKNFLRKKFFIKNFFLKINLILSNQYCFLVLKSNGLPSYNYSSVIDDIDLNINLISRGIDHLSNLYIQFLFFLILKRKLLKIIHLPILLNYNGNKISKSIDNSFYLYKIKKKFFLESIFIFLFYYNLKKFSLKSILRNYIKKRNFYIKINYSDLLNINKKNIKLFNLLYIKNILNLYLVKKFFKNKKFFLKNLFLFLFFKIFFNKINDFRFIIVFYKNNFLRINYFNKNKKKIFFLFLYFFKKKKIFFFKKRKYFLFLKIFLINKINFPFFLKFIKNLKKKIIFKKIKINLLNLKYIVPFV